MSTKKDGAECDPVWEEGGCSCEGDDSRVASPRLEAPWGFLCLLGLVLAISPAPSTAPNTWSVLSGYLVNSR